MEMDLTEKQYRDLSLENDYFSICKLYKIEVKENRDRNPIINIVLEPLCYETDIIDEIAYHEEHKNYYYILDTFLDKHLEIGYSLKSVDGKIRYLKDLFKDKYVILKPRIKALQKINASNRSNHYTSYDVYKNADAEDLIFVSEGFISFYKRIPIVKNKDYFLSKLRNEKTFDFKWYPSKLKKDPEKLALTNENDDYLLKNINKNSVNNLNMVMVENQLYIFQEDDWIPYSEEGKSYSSTKWTYRGQEENIRILNLKDYSDTNFFKDKQENVAFVSVYFLKRFFEDAGIPYTDEYFNTNMREETKEEVEKEILKEEKIKEEKIKEEMVKDNVIKQHSLEESFIEKLKEICQLKKLYYDDLDLINLHISVKTNLISILAGKTGTGKSQLALTYGELLGATIENKKMLFVPVSPSLVEPSDLLGYYNSNLGIYMPSDIGIVNFLVEAEKHPDDLYVIVLDEMNLSQIEHWFAPFLSLLELDEKDRNIELYNKHLRCLNDEKYPSTLKIGENIRIIGTINLDDTTKEMSDRLLDRVNLIEIQQKSFYEMLFGAEENVLRKSDFSWPDEKVYKVYRNWIKHRDLKEVFSKKEIAFLDSLNAILDTFDTNKTISYRVLYKIGEYLDNIPVLYSDRILFNRDLALDLQIKQRVLTKIKGNSTEIESLIGTYDHETEKLVGGTLLKLLESDEAKEISHFIFSERFLLKKAKEIFRYGYSY